jgi:hypothetical protein
MSDLKRRWSHLKAAFGPAKAAPQIVTHLYVNGEEMGRAVGDQVLTFNNRLAKTMLGQSGLLGPAGVANAAGFKVGHAWARAVLGADPPPDRGLIR